MQPRLANRAGGAPKKTRRHKPPACPRLPVCLLDELRAGAAVEVQRKKGRHLVIAAGATKPLASRKHAADALQLLDAARKEVSLAAEDAASSAELERRRLTHVITPQRPEGEVAQYRIVDASNLVASHDPESFAPDPRYPKGVQEREYQRQPEEQRKVVMGAQLLNPALLLTDTPTAVDGPPIVARNGPPWIALGGNGRSMMIRRAYKEGLPTAQRYLQALIADAPHFGFTFADVAAHKHPILVRVLDDVPAAAPAPELVAAVRRLNEGLTQQLSPRVRAVAEAKVLSPTTIEALGELLAGAGDASLRDVLRSEPRRIVEILERDGVVNAQNRAQWVAGGQLTDEAKDRLEGMFLGRVVGTGDRLAVTSPATLQKLERAVPALLRVAGVNPALDEIPHVQRALDLLNDARAHNVSLADLVRQDTLFGEGGPVEDDARLARMFEQLTQRQVGDRFRRWAQRAGQDPRQPRMFEAPPTRADSDAILLEGVRLENPAPTVLSDATTTEGIARDLLRQLGYVPRSGVVIVQRKQPVFLEFKGGQVHQFMFRGRHRPKLARELARDLKARTANPGKYPAPSPAISDLVGALRSKWKRETPAARREVLRLERLVRENEGAEGLAQAFRIAHAAARRSP